MDIQESLILAIIISFSVGFLCLIIGSFNPEHFGGIILCGWISIFIGVIFFAIAFVVALIR